MKKIKVLQVVPSLSQANGISSYIINYLKNMDKTNLDITFLVLNDRNNERYDEVIANNCKVIELYLEKNILKYFKKLDDFFKNNKFDIIHCHIPNYGAFIMWFAKKHNVKIRILHSHVNKSSDRLIKKIRNDILSPFAVKNSNVYLACSKDAGKYLFKNKKFQIINNAIDVNMYSYSSKNRNEYRKKLNLEDKFVIGEFGRLCPQKNQLFALDILKNMLKIKRNTVLVFAGDGYLEEKIIKKAEKLNIRDSVLLLGSRKDLNKLYNCLDVFLLPSTYEGLGIVLIEAQANGLKCFTSKDLVPEKANVSGLVTYIPLNNNSKEWADKILNDEYKRIDVSNEIRKNGFDIVKESNKLSELYINLYNDNWGR